MRPTILFLFNSSAYAVQPWLDSGEFNCVSVDYDASDHSGEHRRPPDSHPRHTRLDIDLTGHRPIEAIKWALDTKGLAEPSFVLSFAPCTDLAVCGNRSRAQKLIDNPNLLTEALQLATLVEHWDCPSIVENPVSLLATLWKKPTVYVHPWYFSYLIDHDKGDHPEFPSIIPPFDWYNKKTGLWCQNGAQMPQRDTLGPQEGPKGDFPGYAQLGGKSARTKYIRSLTPRGLAMAIYLSNAPLVRTQQGQSVLECIQEEQLTFNF